MKKFIKNNLFGFLIGGLIFGSIGIYGTNVYQSSAIEYSPTDASWEVDNVNEAINSLHNLVNSSSISKIAKDTSGNEASVHYYGARISSVTKTFNMNKGKYTLFVFSTYNDIYSATATGGDTTNQTVVNGGKITKINDYCYIVEVENDNTSISVTIKSYGANEDRRTIYGIYFYE